MFTEALYYPNILIPDDLWLRRAILYWDKINPIVPREVERDIPENHVSRELQKAGILKYIDPGEILEYQDGQELSNKFLKVIKSKRFLSQIGTPNIRRYEVKIHHNKFTNGLLEELRNQDLFKNSLDGWLYFEKNSGIIYLGFLASSLAKRLNLEPVTDRKLYQDGYILSQLIPSSRYSTSITSFRLENLLPSPREQIPINQLLGFKEKHERELLSFRRSIRENINSLEKIAPNQYEAKLIDIREEIREQCLIIDARLKENRIETVHNVLEVPFNIAKNDVSTLGTLVAATGATISVPVAAALAGANAAIKILRVIFKGYIRSNTILEEYPYSYVFNIQKKLGGKY
jgi:hypothetical protein